MEYNARGTKTTNEQKTNNVSVELPSNLILYLFFVLLVQPL